MITTGITIYLIYSEIHDAPKPQDSAQGQSTTNEDGLDVLDPQSLVVPLQSRNGPAPQPWDENSRITILLLGVDDRVWMTNDGPPRTDVIILVTINPENKTMGMLSLPRDLWVDVPGYGNHKINQAYFLGVADAYPSGGAGLALATVEKFLDVDIPYYVRIDFNTFVHLINKIGGVKLNVPKEIKLDFGDGNIKQLQRGVQTLPGDYTLAYVRARHTDGGDFDRMARQQLVLDAIKQRVTDFDLIPTLMREFPSIYQEVADGTSTNLTLQQIVQLAKLGGDIPRENILYMTIGLDRVSPDMNVRGEYILRPDITEIKSLRNAVFALEPSPITPTPIPPAATPTEVQPTPMEAQPTETQEKDIAVAVHNGTLIAGLAGETADYLKNNAFTVTDVGNTERLYAYTTIIDYTGNSQTIVTLAELLSVAKSKIYSSYDPDSQVDILVILGNDWAVDNPWH
ncbi:MAG: LCP family protein [Chloroflexota bacterium]|nr:LCP family protein [Chloroflexota bacterium]